MRSIWSTPEAMWASLVGSKSTGSAMGDGGVVRAGEGSAMGDVEGHGPVAHGTRHRAYGAVELGPRKHADDAHVLLAKQHDHSQGGRFPSANFLWAVMGLLRKSWLDSQISEAPQRE